MGSKSFQPFFVNMSSKPPMYTSQVRTKFLSRSVEHPWLISTVASLIRTFLREYEQYAKEVELRAREVMPSANTSMLEPVHPVNRKF